MQRFENRMLQLETKPKTRISEYSVTPQGDEGKSPTAPPTAWITAPSQLNLDRDKIFNFSTKTSDQNFGVNLASAPRFLFGAPTNQVVLPMLALVLSASLTLIVTKSLDSQHPRTSKEPPGRPHLLRMDSSLEPWQICKLPRRPLLPHTQMKLRIKRIYKECLMLLRTRACSSELP